MNDLTQIRITLEGERDSLSAALGEAENANSDLESRLAGANGALGNVKAELERRLREKEDELEGLRYWKYIINIIPQFLTAANFADINSNE